MAYARRRFRFRARNEPSTELRKADCGAGCGTQEEARSQTSNMESLQYVELSVCRFIVVF